MWVLKTKLRSSGLQGKRFYTPRHLTVSLAILLPFSRSSLLFGDYFLCCAELSVRLVPKGIVILDLEFEIITTRLKHAFISRKLQSARFTSLKKSLYKFLWCKKFMLWELNSWEAFWHIAGFGRVSLQKVVERLEKWLSDGKRSGDYGGWGKCLKPSLFNF